MNRTRAFTSLSLAILLALPGPSASAQEATPGAPDPRQGDTLGWHVVQPGESFARITGARL